MRKTIICLTLLLCVLSLAGCSAIAAETTTAPTSLPTQTTAAPTEITTQPPTETTTQATEPETTEPTVETTEETTEPTEESTEAPTETTQETAAAEGTDYILNKNSKKFHYPDCSSVNQMKESNKEAYTGTRDDLIGSGYNPCGNCDP